MEPPPKKRCPHSTTAPELTLGAPRTQAASGRYVTKGGVTVDRLVKPLADPSEALEGLIDQLDQERGCVFQSSYEVPGRYARWTMGFVNPPLAFEGWGRRFTITALNKRGSALLPAIRAALQGIPALASLKVDGEAALHGSVKEVEAFFTEEERSRQHSIFSVVRALIDLFGYDLEVQLGLYGAFGYDLTFQFETVALTQRRDATQRDLVLYLPDEIMVIDVLANASWRLSYDFTAAGQSTAGLPRTGATLPYAPLPADQLPRRRDHGPGDFAKKVEVAKEQFRLGNLFECVLSQTFTEPCPQPPSEVFRRLRKRNPSPYGFLINLGDTEYLLETSNPNPSPSPNPDPDPSSNPNPNPDPDPDPDPNPKSNSNPYSGPGTSWVLPPRCSCASSITTRGGGARPATSPAPYLRHRLPSYHPYQVRDLPDLRHHPAGA